MPEAVSDGADPNNYESGYRYVTETWTNWAEKQRQDALESLRKELGEDANMNGKFATVRRVEF